MGQGVRGCVGMGVCTRRGCARGIRGGKHRACVKLGTWKKKKRACGIVGVGGASSRWTHLVCGGYRGLAVKEMAPLGKTQKKA